MKTKIVNGAVVTEIEVDPSKTNDQLERESYEYSVAKIKTFRGMEGDGLNAVLLRGKKKVADLLDEGRGGMMHYYWVDHNKGGEEGLFKAFVKAEKAKIPADLKDKEGFNEHDLFDGDVWVWMQVDKVVNDKRFRKACKTKTLFQVGDKIGSDQFMALKGVDLATRQYIEKQYKGQKIRILNDEYK